MPLRFHVRRPVRFATLLCLAIALFGTGARADYLLSGYGNGSAGGVNKIDPVTLQVTGPVFTTATKPNGIAHSSTNIYATDANNNKLRYNLAGTLLTSYSAGSIQGPVAFGGGNLFVAYNNPPSFSGIALTDPVTLSDTGGIPQAFPSGLAWANNSIYSASFSILRRYNAAGQILGQGDGSTAESFGPIAVGNGIFFESYKANDGSAYGIRFRDALTFVPTGQSIATPSAVTGMTFGNDSLYAVLGNGQLSRYDLTGQLIGSANLGSAAGGPLDYAPEPSSLTLMGAASLAALRRRGRGRS